MVYFIGNRDSVNYGAKIEICSIEFCLEYFKNREYIQFDCETTGFDCHLNKLLCFQLGDYENQFVILPEHLPSFKELLLSNILIGHNIKFDLKFLYKQGIFPERVYDTMLAEAVLYCGIKAHKKALDAVVERYIPGVVLDKSIRKNIGKNGLKLEEIIYSAKDVQYLEKVKDSQKELLTKWDLHKTLELENNFCIVLAYIEYCGFYLNSNDWKAKMEEDIIFVNQKKLELDNFILDNNLSKYIDNQLDLFSEEQKITINWDSPKQVVSLFKDLNIPVDIVEKGERKESVGAKAIARYEKEFPIVKSYLTYKELQKVVGTYGQNFLDQINPVTGRIHTNFYQIQDTGRMSSGGKNRATGEEYINFQNIPADDRTRFCFMAREGNVLIDADYSSQEKIILANKSLDPKLLEFFDNDIGDLHSFTAKNMYPELRDLDLKTIKKEHADKRYNAKSAGFAIDYGGNALTIATNENISIEDANNIYNGYFAAFPALKDFFAKQSQEGIDNGFILIDGITRRKHFIQHYERFLEEKSNINRAFWDRWKIIKQNPGSQEYAENKEKISHYFKVKGSIERKGLNYGIQGCAASITKISGILIFDWIRKNNYINKVLFVNQVHDENVLESPTELSEIVREVVEDCMIEAGKEFCKRTPLKAEANITNVWKH